MLRDNHLIFSEAQAFTSTEISDNVHDLSVAGRELGDGAELFLHLQVDTAFAGGGTVNFQLHSDSVEALSSPSLMYATGALSTAVLTAGLRIKIPLGISSLPYEQYLGMTYTVASTVSAGAITAWIGPQGESFKAPPSGKTFL